MSAGRGAAVLTVDTGDTATVLTFPLALACLPILVGAVLLAIGWWRRRRGRGRAGVWWLAAGALVLVTLGPSLLASRIVVDEHGITARVGFWFAPTRKELRFDAVRHVEQHVELPSVRGRRYETPQDVWMLHRRDGTVERLPLDDLWRWHREALIHACTAHGVTVG